MKSISRQYQHQHDLNGCGIACLANLLNEEYIDVRYDFEKLFYQIDKGIKVFDLVKFLSSKGYRYSNKFFNHNNYNKSEAYKFANIINSITLIRKNDKYPVGHYLLRVENGWIDPWLNYPSIDNVHAGVRKELPAQIACRS